MEKTTIDILPNTNRKKRREFGRKQNNGITPDSTLAPKINERDYIDTIISDNIECIINKKNGILWEVPTGGAKTFAGITKTIYKLVLDYPKEKVLHVVLNPFSTLKDSLKYQFKRFEVNCHSVDEFCQKTISENHVVVVDTWQKNITEGRYKKEGDNYSFIEKLNSLRKKGYKIVAYIDEMHLFSTTDAPKVKNFMEDVKFDTSLLYSATPTNIFNNIKHRKIELSEVVKKGFVKNNITFKEEESEIKRIQKTFEELNKISEEYKNLGIITKPKAMFVLPTDSGKNKNKYELYLTSIKNFMSNNGLNPESQLYDMSVVGKKNNIYKVEDQKEFDSENCEFRVIVTKKAGITGLSIHSLEVGCILSELNERDQIQVTGRFVRNLNEKTKNISPVLIIGTDSSITWGKGGFDDVSVVGEIILTKYYDVKFPFGGVTSLKHNKSTFNDFFVKNIKINDIVQYGTYHYYNGEINVTIEKVLSGETLNPDGCDIVNNIDIETAKTKVINLFKNFEINFEDYMALFKEKLNLDTYKKTYEILAIQENLDTINKWLHESKIQYNSDINIFSQQNVDYGDITLPKKINIVKGHGCQLIDDGIYEGMTPFDNEGEIISFMNFKRYGWDIFRNINIISIPYLYQGKWHLYFPDFVGFDHNKELVALDRKGKMVPSDQINGIVEKHNAANNMGYKHYICTEDKKVVYLNQPSEVFIPYGAKTEGWETIK